MHIDLLVLFYNFQILFASKHTIVEVHSSLVLFSSSCSSPKFFRGGDELVLHRLLGRNLCPKVAILLKRNVIQYFAIFQFILSITHQPLYLKIYCPLPFGIIFENHENGKREIDTDNYFYLQTIIQVAHKNVNFACHLQLIREVFL